MHGISSPDFAPALVIIFVIADQQVVGGLSDSVGSCVAEKTIQCLTRTMPAALSDPSSGTDRALRITRHFFNASLAIYFRASFAVTIPVTWPSATTGMCLKPPTDILLRAILSESPPSTVSGPGVM